MTKPEDIPQDVWDNALEAMHPEVRRHYATSPMAMVQHLSIARAILSAVEEERERNAKVAETYRANMSIWMSDEWKTAQLATNYAGQAIASAIRNRKES